MNQQVKCSRLLESFPVKGVPGEAPSAIHSVASGPGGLFFISDEFNHRIIVLTRKGEFVRSIGSKGNGPGQFWYPRGLAMVETSGGHELYVCDSWNHRICRYTPDGGFIASFGSIGSGSDEFNEPVAIETAPDTLFILDRGNNRIKIHQLDGRAVSAFGAAMTTGEEKASVDPEFFISGKPQPAYGFHFPQAFARFDDGSFVVADTGNRRLVILAPDGSLLSVIKLDVQGKPPYKYPVSLKRLGDGHVLLGCLNSGVELMDIRRPWLRMDTGLCDDPVFHAALYAAPEDSAAITVFAIDGRKGVIERHEAALPSGQTSPEPAGMPGEKELVEAPDRWTEMGKPQWETYLAASCGGGNDGALASRFVFLCQHSASLAAKSLNDAETELLQTASRLAEVFFLSQTGGRKSGEIENDLMRLRLQYTMAARHREAARWTLLDILSSVTGVLNGCFAGELTKERDKFTAMALDEYTRRGKDLADVTGWLGERLANVETINIAACAHAFTAVLQLLDHLSYLDRLLSRMGAEHDAAPSPRERRLLAPVMAYRRVPMGVAYSAVNVIAHSCVSFGYPRTALATCQACMEKVIPSAKVELAIVAHDALEAAGAGRAQLAGVLLTVAKEHVSQESALGLVSRLQRAGEFGTSGNLINRYAKAAKDPGMWKNLSRAQEVAPAVMHSSISLAEGQSAADALRSIGAAPPASGAGLVYVTSLPLVDDVSGSPIHPYMIKAVRQDTLLVADISGRLYLYKDGGRPERLFEEWGRMITGIEMVSDNAAALIMYDTAPPYDFAGWRMLDIATGEARDISGEIACQMPKEPFRITSHGSSGLIVSGLEGRKGEPPVIWTASRDFKESAPLADIKYRVGDISSNGEALAVTLWIDNIIAFMDIREPERMIMSDRFALSPSGVAHDEAGLVYAASGAGFGLQAYSPEGDFLFQVSALRKEGESMVLHCGSLTRKTGFSFAGGDLVLSDREKSRLHVFRLGG